VTSSCLCKKVEGAFFPFGLLVHAVEDGIDNPVDALDVDEAGHGPVRRRTSTKQRSITLVVGSLRHSGRGKLKNESRSGKSRSRRLTMAG